MNRLRDTVRSYRRQLYAVMRNEYATIFSDKGVMLVMVFALLIYPTIYSLGYGAEVLRNVPVGVVDMSKTSASRKLVDAINMGPNTVVAYELSDMVEAQKKFYDRDIYGILYIPNDYEQKLLGGQMATVSIYLDASYMLMYRQAFQEMVAGINTTGAMVEFQRMIAKGANLPQAKAITQPVIYESHSLFNPYLGYGTFVMPPIILVIIQQTLLVGIGMIGGTWREHGMYGKLKPRGSRRMSTFPIVIGKALTYASLYAVTTFYLMNVHYRVFHYPMNGRTLTVVLFLVMYIFACIFMGIALSSLFRRRENSLMMLLWTSIPIFLLSGASFPQEAMPEWLRRFAYIFPSTHGATGFVRIQSMGASLGDVWPEIRALIRLIVVYMGLSFIGIHFLVENDLADRIRNRWRRRVARYRLAKETARK